MNLRIFILVFNILVGMALSIFACIATRLRKKFVILADIFFTTAAMVAYTTYAYRWADKAFIYTLLPVATLISWFVLGFKGRRPLTTRVVKVFKILGVAAIVFFTALTPLLMYSHMAFVYPPSTDLAILKFQARHGQGSLLVIGGHTDLEYVMFAEEASMAKIRWRGNPVPDSKELPDWLCCWLQPYCYIIPRLYERCFRKV
ncbi:MAG: hypothetical protein ACUVTD_01255 [Nitrososphaerales archaeon]